MATLIKGTLPTSMETEAEYPIALIERLRSHLVDAGAGRQVSCSNPSALPTLDQLIANAAPSTPFRCQKCKAPLLLGSTSQRCGACGTWRDVAFEISFASTLAYQYLMDSFQSDATPDDASGKSTTNTEAANVQIQRTVQEGLVAHDISNLGLKWPEDKSGTSRKHSSRVLTANSSNPYRVEVDLEDFFGESKQDVSDAFKKSVTPRDQIRGVDWHEPDGILPQLNPKDNNVDLFSSVLGRENAPLCTEDDDTSISFAGNFKGAKPAIEISGSKSFDRHTSLSAGNPFHFMEANKELSWPGNRRPIVNGKDSINGTGNVIAMQESWTQDDPWSAVIMEESYRGSSKNFNEEIDSLSDWQGAHFSANSTDLLSDSTWHQCDILKHDDLTEVMTKQHKAGENRVSELDVHPEPYPSLQGIKFEKEAGSAIDISEINLSSRTGDKEGSKTMEDAMNSFSTAMPQSSLNTDSNQVVESLLSQMHDLSFMLADHLVIPGGHIEQ